VACVCPAITGSWPRPPTSSHAEERELAAGEDKPVEAQAEQESAGSDHHPIDRQGHQARLTALVE
jgi:hypothetical protein